MREIRFDGASARSAVLGSCDLTFAAKKLPDDVGEAEKKRRLSEIVALQEQISAEVFGAGAHVGRLQRVLVTGAEQARSGAARRADGIWLQVRHPVRPGWARSAKLVDRH